MSGRADALRAAAEAAGQGHVFRFFAELELPERERLLDQVEGVDFALVGRLAQLARSTAADAEGHSAFEPPDVFALARDAAREREAAEARRAGEALLRAGRVGYLLVAGGQASRLGYEGPKGAFPIGPVSERTLFWFHARRLLAARARFGAPTPFYVMTSPANDAPTRDFFERHDHFGLAREDVFFFPQAMLPALDPDGRILLVERGALFLAPNGHGGVLAALSSSGALDDMRARGVTTISYIQVDNPLARPADVLFLGLHARAGAGMSSKVVAKRGPDEKVGVLGRVDGRLGCIEYSDLPARLRNARDGAGELVYNAGNIAVHVLERDFVAELTRADLELPWHVARKRVRALDEHGQSVERAGVKFETFVFDALSRSTASVTLEVDRSLEFSPVKNAEGEDSPASARRDLCRLFAGWARSAGLALPEALEGGEPRVEVDPLVAEDEHELRARGTLRPTVRAGGHLFEAS